MHNQPSKRVKTAAIVIAAAILSWSWGTDWRTLLAQAALTPTDEAVAELERDPYDRNLALWAMRRSGASSGPRRGQEVFYMRCWNCHNEYTVAAEPGAAPSLRDLYKQPRLRVSGQPVSDETVAAHIRRGSPRMPAYTTAMVSDAELADLLSYLRVGCSSSAPTDAGCFDLHNPPADPLYRRQAVAASGGQAAPASRLRGGPRGVVRTADRRPVGGLMVQLISASTSIRTTVYTDELGRYEFPPVDAGEYTLRLPRPLEFQRHVRGGIRIDGPTALPDIVAERVTKGPFLPPTASILTQLTGAEILTSMRATPEERMALEGCGSACHGPDYIYRARFDEASWRKLVHRMMDYGFRVLLFPQPGDRDENELIVKWLGRNHGLDAPPPAPIKPFPRPYGPATRAVITEYELPWALADNIHDVAGDADGNIWFTPNKNPIIGKLNPKTGAIAEYRLPPAPPIPPGMTPSERQDYPKPVAGLYPGTHWIQVDRHTGTVWFTDTWAGTLGRVDPRTGDIQLVFTGLHGNVGLSPDGKSVWRTDQRKIKQYDTATVMQTGKPVKEYDLTRLNSTYGNFLSRDGRYFGGGGSGIVWLDTQTGELREIAIDARGRGRGDFDRDGNIWIGTTRLVKYDPKTGAVGEYAAPTPNIHFYTARADKNGEIWAGEMQGGRVARFNPKTFRWIEYVLPNPWSFDYHSWIDDSTDPPTYWYGDNYGYIVRIQPLE